MQQIIFKKGRSNTAKCALSIPEQEAQLSQRDSAMLVSLNIFAKSLKITQGQLWLMTRIR